MLLKVPVNEVRINTAMAKTIFLLLGLPTTYLMLAGISNIPDEADHINVLILSVFKCVTC